MTKHSDIPVFGNLDGLRVVSVGNAYAGPFAATVMAEQGADVIWIENALAPEATRTKNISFANNLDRRNERFLALNIPAPEGKEIFQRLMAKTDILIENYKGGQFAKWGLDDETLWKANPRLVITHVSGFGQEGDPEYVERPSWDGIGQAFSGYMFLNGYPEPEPPMRVNPLTCDYITALTACWSSLAALRKATLTGKGESIDVAQFEAMMRVQSDYPMKYLNKGKQVMRNGNTDTLMTGYNVFKCKDGKYVFVGWVGMSAMKKGLPLLGLEFPSKDFPAMPLVVQGTPGSKIFMEKLTDFCAQRDQCDVEKELLAAGVPCQAVTDYHDAVENPHYQARKVFMEWDGDYEYGHLKGTSPVPKFKKNPSQIWRGYSAFGGDNNDILGELGYQPEEIADLTAKKILNKE
jgi:L-carnitine CoA-transferase